MKLDGLLYRYPGREGFQLGPLTVEGPDDRPWILLGPSGSGKSTLLRLLGGGLRATGGGIEVTAGGRSAYLPQLPERVLTGRNLAEDLCGDPRPELGRRLEMRAALRAVGLEGAGLARSSRRLSAGERRRLALALLLLCGHDHWALDEPDAALDARGVERVMAVLASRPVSARSRLWIATHRHELYAPLRPWTLVLHRGGLVAAGDLGEVLSRQEVNGCLGLARRPAFRLWAAMQELPEGPRGGLLEPPAAGSGAAQVHVLLALEAGLR